MVIACTSLSKKIKYSLCLHEITPSDRHNCFSFYMQVHNPREQHVWQKHTNPTHPEAAGSQGNFFSEPLHSVTLNPFWRNVNEDFNQRTFPTVPFHQSLFWREVKQLSLLSSKPLWQKTFILSRRTHRTFYTWQLVFLKGTFEISEALIHKMNYLYYAFNLKQVPDLYLIGPMCMYRKWLQGSWHGRILIRQPGSFCPNDQLSPVGMRLSGRPELNFINV